MINLSLFSKNLISAFAAIMTLTVGVHASAFDQVEAKPSQKGSFKFTDPGYTDEERKAIEDEVNAALAYEEMESAQQKDYKQIPVPVMNAATAAFENGDKILVEIYQNAPAIKVYNEKRQFMVVKQNGNIRYVFQISAAGSGKSTPESKGRVIEKQRWRHMSTLYPSKGENNMDHVSYFHGAIGFHSTVFGLYSKLGKPDSHGCVRMARPEARVLYSLIKPNFSTTKVNSYKAERNPPANEQDQITKLLQLDVDFINNLRKSKNKGDTLPGNMTYSEYIENKRLNTLDRKQIEIDPQQDNFYVNPDLARN
jgi:lipoprotein-anchoring transpeptidase ErfK/SrfK